MKKFKVGDLVVLEGYLGNTRGEIVEDLGNDFYRIVDIDSDEPRPFVYENSYNDLELWPEGA